MSVNITVNGKFAKHCRSHPLLNDPQEVRKAEEKERRKLRLLQVCVNYLRISLNYFYKNKKNYVKGSRRVQKVSQKDTR